MDILSFIPQFGSLAGTIIAFVVALSVIVAVHEYGHYIVGRWTGIKAEVFSLGFGPVLWSREDRHGTKWQFAALPFGGYVKFLGDANAASAGTDDAAVAELSPEEQRHTMIGAPLWARTLTVAAGPVFNFIFSALVFTAIILVSGKPSEQEIIGSMHPIQGVVNELRKGDEIVSIGGVNLRDEEGKVDHERLRSDVPRMRELTYYVNRDGAQVKAQGPYPFPPLVEGVTPLSAAADAGLMVGDLITAVDDEPIFAFNRLKDLVVAAEGRPVKLEVLRDGQTAEFVLKPRQTDVPLAEGGFKAEYLIGIAGNIFYETAREGIGLWEALKLGTTGVWQVIEMAFSGLYHLVSGAISSCNMAGPITIAQLAGHSASQGADSFIQLVAVISTAIGLFNLFPVPVLDGGHLVFYAYEAVFRRPAPERVHAALMYLGLAMLLSLMIFAVGNDIVCWLIRKEWWPG